MGEKEPAGGPKVLGQGVCITGMHRSGTSAVARMANLLGLDLGPETKMLPPAEDNPRGFWEHRELMETNVALLARLERRSDDPRLPLPARWWREAGLADLRSRAATKLLEDFASASLWGWKDPRNCLTLPFWQELCGELVYLLAVRHPLEVAQSLWRRGRYQLSWGLHLWAAYHYEFLRNAPSRKVLVLAYGNVLDDPEASARRLGAFLGLEPNETKLAAIRTFLAPELKHHEAAALRWPAETPQLVFSLAWRWLSGKHGKPLGELTRWCLVALLRSWAIHPKASLARPGAQ